MKRSKDPFEAAYENEEEEESPPESPAANNLDDYDSQPISAATAAQNAVDDDDYDDFGDAGGGAAPRSNIGSGSGTGSGSGSGLPRNSTMVALSSAAPNLKGKGKVVNDGHNNKDEDYDDDEDNVEVELSKFPSSHDPNKSEKMKAILSQFTEGQMSRYESFRRSALQKSNMRRLLVSITGSQKISLPMTIVVCGIAKMFVGELVETARIVMTERRESGPIRPCHIREAYRRLKLEGKIPRRSVPRLFR